MKISELKQEKIDEYVASTNDFWNYSKIALKSPFSFWNKLANSTIPEIIMAFYDNNSNGASGHFNIIFGVPLIKGEFPCVYGSKSGVIITNYRYFANKKEGLVIIPFHSIKSIGKESAQGNDGFDKAINKIFGEDKEIVINYSKNDIDFKYKNPEFLDYLQNAYNHKEYTLLNEFQKIIIENTYYEFEKFNSNLVFPKINWQSSLDYIKDLKITSMPESKESINQPNEEKTKKSTEENQEKLNNNVNGGKFMKILKILIIALVISFVVGFAVSIFGTLGGGSNYGFVQQEGMNKINSMSDTAGIVAAIITFIIVCYKGFVNLNNKSYFAIGRF